jgi:hypothetical protein
MKEKRKREGTYRTGMNLDDPDDDEAPASGPAKKARATTAKEGIHCQFCGRDDHVRRNSKKCTAPVNSVKMYRQDGSLLTEDPRPARPALLSAEALLAQQDCDAMDSMPFDAEYYSDDDENLARFLLEGGYDSSEDDSLPDSSATTSRAKRSGPI